MDGNKTAFTINHFKNQARRCFAKGTLAINLGDFPPSRFHVKQAKTISSQFKVYFEKIQIGGGSFLS